MSTATLPAIEPRPPQAPGRLPWVGAGLGLLRDPTAFFQRCRERLGDTFAVDAFGYRLLCVFSPEGVKQLWALPEAEASKGAADFALLSHKVPRALFAGRRTFPHGLFGQEEMEVYLANLREAVEIELRGLGQAGSFEIFAFTRRLAHRVGLACWGGIEAASPRYLPRLARLFDRLDSSESFVHPSRAFLTVATRKRRERRAMEEIEALFREILARRSPAAEPSGDLFERICSAWGDMEGPERESGIARDVILVHLGSQSNLFAAMGWTLVNLLARPELLERVRGGDLELLERCANESIRLAQRSIVLRRALRPVEIADEKTRYRVAPGGFLATMMSVTNTTAAPGLDAFDPDHYRGPVYTGYRELPARELVSTYGHGRHSCPAQRFSTSAIRLSLAALLGRFELEPGYVAPRPLRRQLGGVARADRRCPVSYRLR